MTKAILFILAARAIAAPALSDRIQISEVVGPKDVKVVRAVGGKEVTLHNGEDLFVGDTLSVAPKQIVGITAYDGSQWKLAPGTVFKAEARKADKATQSFWAFQLIKGSMWGKVKKEAEPKDGFRLKVRTKTAALGIRGTEYLLEGDDTRSGMDVLEGTVWWGNDPAFAPGTYQEITAGHHGEVGVDGKVVVSDTKEDVPALKKKYGLTISADAQSGAAAAGTTAQCLALGKGWKSKDGSSQGECMDKAE
ncbi:MAG: FecR domain-containing protein [Bdellovibrionota bacterium]